MGENERLSLAHRSLILSVPSNGVVLTSSQRYSRVRNSEAGNENQDVVFFEEQTNCSTILFILMLAITSEDDEVSVRYRKCFRKQRVLSALDSTR